MSLLREETIVAPQWVWLVASVFCLSWVLVVGIALIPQLVSGSAPLIAEPLPSFLFVIQLRQALILLAWLCCGLVQAESKRSLIAIVNKAEVLISQLVRMNILMWNCRGALNPDFKRRVFELVVNHRPSIMVITETKVGGERAKKIIEGLPFGFITTGTIGYAGGLWILWNKEGVEISLLANTEQEIHATLKVHASNLSWLFSAIYASPRMAKRQILWSNIEEVGQLHSMPWLMIGDFNEVLCGEGKFGGNQININRAMEFKACLDSCSVVDLGFAGPKYTWMNKRQLTNLLLERIDQCFTNPLWRVLYPEAAVTHLPRTYSDHHPVLIEL